MNVDLMTLSAHKLYGPKGVGALYIRRGVRVADFMEGGEQEKGRRAGTLNVPGIVGFGAAVRKWSAKISDESSRLQELRDRLIERVERDAPGARLMGSRKQRLPSNAHFCFDGVEGEPLLLSLDMAGVCASAGSACSAGSTEPSHVLLAMGLSVEQARGALRLTLGSNTTAESVDYAAGCIAGAVRDLRALS
jgi:cysteine desulfurase